MREPTRDPGLDTLLELHGETMFVDAAALLEDFWREVDQVLGEEGSIP